MTLAASELSADENRLPTIAEDEIVKTETNAGPNREPQGLVRPGRRTENAPRLSDAELDIARKLSFSAALEQPGGGGSTSGEAGNHRVQIVIRIRPLPQSTSSEDKNKDEDDDANAANGRRSSGGGSDGACFRVLSDTAMVAQPPKTSQAYRSTGTATSFHFSHIFQEPTAQATLFEATTKPVLDSAFNGLNGLVFAYGVTNSGKTYTITGTEEQPGVLPRALRYVMEEVSRRKENDVCPVTKITASYLEIYNENVYDLLSAPVRKRRALRLQDCDGKIQVRGMMEREIKTLREAEELLAIGKKNKQVAETNCNMDSSRSHCIFSLYFYAHVSRTNVTLRSKVSIVDLAGSERGAKTGATGLRMQEASKINGSLMNLMRCLEILRWNQQHPPSLHKMVPFRESKLTRLFQENLIGKKQGPLVMIVAVSPSSHEFDETLRTLKYSAMARELMPVHKPSTRKSSASYYDLDGRLRKRRRTSVQGDAIPPASTEAPKRDSFGRHMKREPGPRPGRPPLRTVRSKSDGEAATVAAATALVAAMEAELEAQRARTLQLEQENEELRVQLSQTNAEKLQMEVQIRAEIGNEMREQLQQIKAQYREMLQRQRGPDDSASSSSSSQSSTLEEERSAWGEERASMQKKITQLHEQLTECEDEIKRIQLRHQEEIAALQAQSGITEDPEEL